MPISAPAVPRHLVDPDGLAALRLAIAVGRDPMSGGGLELFAARSLAGRHGRIAVNAPASLRQPHPPRIESTDDDAAVTEDQPSTVDLVSAAQAGDADAFGMLYDRHFELVYRYIAYRVASPALSEDLTSETFLRALRGIGSFTWQGREFGAWLVTIARNLIADHFKSSRYKLELATSDLVAAGADRASAGPEQEVLTGITNAALLDTVKKLGSEQQECIVLRFLQGMSVAETAQVLGKNEAAVKALQYRAVRALGRLLPTELLG